MAMSTMRFPRKEITPYGKAREKILSGDLLMCSGSGFFSRMIQRGTGSAWSHVGFVMCVEEIDRVMVFESVEPQGIRTVPLSKYLTDYDSHGNPYPGRVAIARHSDFAIKATETALKKFGQFAVGLFGYPYDRDEIARIAARIVSSHLPFSLDEKKSLKRDREYICSEYVWECYLSLGIKVAFDSKEYIAPVDFAKADEVELLEVLK